MKIFHIVENLDKGAVENWLVSSFLESRKFNPELEWTFFCFLPLPGALDQAVIDNGGKIIYSKYKISDKLLFIKNLRKILKEGKFDVFHSHHDYMSGFYVLATIGIAFRSKILQIHNNHVDLPMRDSIAKKFLINLFWINTILFYDQIIGIANFTISRYLGWIPFKKKGVLYYGFDLNKYKDIKPFPIKETLKIDNDAIIILYVGKLDPLKNPIYLLDVLRILNNPLVYYLLVGEGPEEQKIIQKAIELGLQNNVKFLGWRNDVYSIMLASNVFVFPRVEHEKEGFGKVIIEAQAAGLPAIITTGIPQDAVFLKNLADTLPLQNSEKLWAERLSVILNSKKPNQLNGLNVLMNSHFEIKNGTNNLLDLYR